MVTRNGQRIRIVAADDHPLILRGVQEYLNRTPDLQVVATVEQCEDLDRVIGEHRPDLLLVDPGMKFGGNPIQTIGQLRQTHPGLKVLILSAHDGARWVVEAVRAGIDGYVHKTEDPDVLAQAIRQVAGGEVWFSQRLLNVLALEYQQSSELGSHERMVLQTLADGKDLKDLADGLGVSQRTVRRYLSDAMKKLRAQSRGEAIANALRQGLIR